MYKWIAQPFPSVRTFCCVGQCMKLDTDDFVCDPLISSFLHIALVQKLVNWSGSFIAILSAMNGTVASPLCCAATQQLYLLVQRRVVNRDTSVCYQISTPYNYYLNNSQIQNLNTVALPPGHRIQLFHTLKYFVRVLNWRTWEPILVVIMT